MLAEDVRPRYRPLRPIPTGQTPSGHLSEPVLAVLFDVYGTLFVSGVGDIGTAEQPQDPSEGVPEVLSHYGLDRSEDDILAALHAAIEADHRRRKASGNPYPEVDILTIWRQVLGRTLPPESSLDAFARDYEAAANPVWPMPHAAETIAALVRRNILLGIVSNAQFFTPPLFRWFFGKPLVPLGFDSRLIYFSYRHGIAKPSRAPFRWAARRLTERGISPKSALFVGNDMRNDILPAAKTGFATALFAGDARSLRLRKDDPACAGIRPDLVVTDLMQLLKHVDGG